MSDDGYNSGREMKDDKYEEDRAEWKRQKHEYKEAIKRLEHKVDKWRDRFYEREYVSKEMEIIHKDIPDARSGSVGCSSSPSLNV